MESQFQELDANLWKFAHYFEELEPEFQELEANAWEWVHKFQDLEPQFQELEAIFLGVGTEVSGVGASVSGVSIWFVWLRVYYGLYGFYSLYYMVCKVLSFPNTYVPTNMNKVTEVCNFKCFRRRSIFGPKVFTGSIVINDI